MTDVVKRADMRMVQGRHGARFSFESSAELRIDSEGVG